MFYENWGFTEWSTIATIGLSVVAICIAIWSSRSTSKAAEKQIREIKSLSALQIKISLIRLQLDRHDALLKELEKRDKLNNTLKRLNSNINTYENTGQRVSDENMCTILKTEIENLEDLGCQLYKAEMELENLKNKLLNK